MLLILICYFWKRELEMLQLLEDAVVWPNYAPQPEAD